MCENCNVNPVVTPVTVPNPDVLRAGVRNAEENLGNWNQENWFVLGSKLPDGTGTCGTTACLAGHILLGNGESWGRIQARSNKWGLDSIMKGALIALGFEVDDHGQLKDEAWAFHTQIFNYTHGFLPDGDGGEEYVSLARSQEQLNLLKKRITVVTGVTFDE